MAQRAAFQVYAASAGSGKTHALVREYLLKCLVAEQPEAFSSILATTFTVKASQEMKLRILEALAWMAGVGTTPRKALRQDILEATGWDDATLQARSKQVLAAILHHYSSFGVGTLDNFTTRLIKTFAPELGLHPGFDLELDTKQLMREAVDLTLQKVGIDQATTDILRAFQQSLLRDERNWDFRLTLKEAADFLLQERHRTPLKQWLSVTGGSWRAMQTALRARIDERAAALQQWGRTVTEQIAALHMPVDFTRNAKPDRLLNGLVQADWDALANTFENRQFGTATFQTACREGTGFLKVADSKQYPDLERALAQIFEPLQAEAAPLFSALMADRLLDRYFLRTVALAAVDVSLEEIKERRQVMLLAEFNHIISHQIRHEPAPFIYERLGERFQHFFIDEFQDTSSLQWANLEPLLDNALAQGGSAMVVGDGKQAIYRWRNGEVEQFLELIAVASKRQPTAKPWQQQAVLVNLDTSFRSAPEVVQFVNAFLQSQVEVFSHPEYRALMEQGGQHASKDAPGGVELNILGDDDDHAVAAAQRALELTQQGWAPGHMAILVRANKQVKAVAKALREVGLQVVSPESLLLKEQPTVQFLVAALGVLAGKESPEERLLVLDFLVQAGVLKRMDVPELKKTINAKGSATFARFLEAHAAPWDTAMLRTVGMYEAARYLAKWARIEAGDPLVQAFLSEILTYGETRQGSIRGFLQWWDLRDPKLELPEGLHAVKVMTIHKSKGLEFPVVIYPFANQTPTNGKNPEWSWVKAEPLDEMDAFLVPLTAKVARSIGGHFDAEYQRIAEQQRLDLINMAYVAITRAEQLLVIFTDATKSSTNQETAVGLAHGLQATAQRLGWHAEGPGRHLLGVIPKPGAHVVEGVAPSQAHWGRKPAEGMRVAATYPPDWATREESAIGKGEWLHRWMGKLAAGFPAEALPTEVAQWQQHPFWVELSSKALRMLPERSLAGLPLRYRPDLLVEHAEGWWIVDYKTGAESPQHRTQVDAYAQAMAQAGHAVKGRALVYLSDSATRIIQNW